MSLGLLFIFPAHPTVEFWLHSEKKDDKSEKKKSGICFWCHFGVVKSQKVWCDGKSQLSEFVALISTF